MLYASPRRAKHYVLNVAGTLVVGAMFALIGLNAASGCGQRNGACIGPRDFVSSSSVETQAQAQTVATHRAG